MDLRQAVHRATHFRQGVASKDFMLRPRQLADTRLTTHMILRVITNAAELSTNIQQMLLSCSRSHSECVQNEMQLEGLECCHAPLILLLLKSAAINADNALHTTYFEPTREGVPLGEPDQPSTHTHMHTSGQSSRLLIHVYLLSV